MHRLSHVLINRTGTRGLYSSPGPMLYVIAVGIPSLLLTAGVCWFAYLAVTSFRRGRIARGAVLLAVALVPFLAFAARIAQATQAEREHAKCLAGLARTGPITNVPDVIVMRTPLWSNADAARFLAAGFREVDAIGGASPGGREPYVETFTLQPAGGCREALEAWRAKGAAFEDFLGSNLSRCVKPSSREIKGASERNSAVIFLRGVNTTLKGGCKGGAPRELRIKDERGDVLVDYLDDSYAEWPIFPLLVSVKGFETQSPQSARLSDSEFVLRNLKR